MIAAFSTTELKELEMSPLPKPRCISFERFIQELLEDHEEMAYEFRTFTRGRKIRSPLQLLQIVNGSMVQVLGVEGISYWLHLGINLLTLELVEVAIRDTHSGES